VSGALPGAVHDKKAEWIWGVLAELEAAGLVTLADKGYQGARHAKIPYPGEEQAGIPETGQPCPREAPLTRRARERPAQDRLKTWHILRKLRCCPWRAGQLAKAIHVLQIREAHGLFR
jgi:hypothetical protein